jgi:hypothetical protein
MKIMREDAKFFVYPDAEGTLRFDATLDLKDYDLPQDAQVYVEAYRQTSFMRFPHGTAAEPHAPASIDRRLTEFSTRDGMLFRVKVTSISDRPGVLLAEADRIPVTDDEEQPEDRIPLLPPCPEDLGQEVWRVGGLVGEGGPLLLINSRLADWKSVASSPAFRSLVYPAAMRQVLWHIYKVDQMNTMEDVNDWRCRWLTFASALVGQPPLTSEDDDEWDRWIGDAVESFARRHQMLERFQTFLTEIDA